MKHIQMRDGRWCIDLIPFFSTSRNFETSSFVIVPSW
jgi:hypothetical protein